MNQELVSDSIDYIFSSPLVIVNIGIRPFFETLHELGAEIYQVDWNIPAGGDQELLHVLDLLLE